MMQNNNKCHRAIVLFLAIFGYIINISPLLDSLKRDWYAESVKVLQKLDYRCSFINFLFLHNLTGSDSNHIPSISRFSSDYGAGVADLMVADPSIQNHEIQLPLERDKNMGTVYTGRN